MVVATRADLEKILQKHIPIKTAQKAALGEVFTPLSVVEDLLAQFPAAVWRNKDLKWLDPANGVGNVPIVVFFKLMDGLRTVIPNETKRAEHIVRNMLYMVEIGSENVAICREIFHDLCPSVEPNLIEGDFLDLSKQSGLQVDGWPTHVDCVVGNPPYNLAGTKREGTKRAHIAFTKHSLDCLTSKGFLGFICPPNYREAGSLMNRMLKDANGRFWGIHMLGSDEAHRLFKIQSRVDLFVFQKGAKGTTKIRDVFGETSTVQVDIERHIPNFGFSIFEKLARLVEKLGSVRGYRITEMTTVHQDKFACGKHPVVHLFVAGGRRVFKVAKKHSLEGVPKVLINGLGLPYVYVDWDGRYGVTQTPLVVEEPTEGLAVFLQSPLFQCIAWGMRMTGNNNLPYLLGSVPNVRRLELKTVEDVYSLVGLTQKEILFLEENFQVPVSADKDIVEACKRKTRRST